jgi:membrane glycosyltransferase
MDHYPAYRLSPNAGGRIAGTAAGANTPIQGGMRPVAVAPAAASLAAPGASMPPMRRGSMVPKPWRGFTRSLLEAGTHAAWTALAALGRAVTPWRASAAASATASAAPAAWEVAAGHRRNVLLGLVLVSAAGATGLLSLILPGHPYAGLRLLQIALFGVLFAWVSAGFFTAIMGFWVLWRGDPHALSARSAGTGAIDPGARTAIIMPICNEQVATVFAGLRATWESLAGSAAAPLFDLFILSDTSDPATRAAELAAWAQLRSDTGADGRIHYRWRQRRVKRKSGNVADFCRRWGRAYRYMVVLDADSVMSGDCLEKLLRLMEANPTAGILQTAPQTCGLTTVHARSQQFASRVAGRLFTAGMQYWQLGESHYWGHNAIIRIAPFMAHCALAPLSGRGGLSGEIMSHDFVEAALMRRAGFHVWLVNDLGGSYEQQPPNLLEELQRDRRWCQGNLQNARLIAEHGLHGVHRTMLLTGALAYLSAPLWLAFVLVGAGLWIFTDALDPASVRELPLAVSPLWFATALMLILPRVLGVLAIVLRREQRSYGGVAGLVRGTLLEGALSVLQAPVRMMAHTVFVFVALSGLKLDWKSPPREATDIAWSDAAGRFAAVGVLVALVSGLAFLVQPMAIVWLSPMILPLLLAVPLAVFTGRATIGDRLLARGLLLTPEETATPAVLLKAWGYARNAGASPTWRDTFTNPWLFDVVRSAMGTRNTGWGVRGKARRLLVRGILDHTAMERLSRAERMRLLSEPQNLVRLRDQLVATEPFAPTRRAHNPPAASSRPSPAARPGWADRRAAARTASGMAGA